MTVRRRTGVLAALLLAGSALISLPPAATADTGPQPLAMTGFADLVLDEELGHLFLSPGPSGTGVQVTDLQGVPVAVIDGLPGATGMAPSPDGASLWVALPTVGALAQVDLTTLQVVKQLSVPTGQCPGDVAVVGSRLVYGHSCNTYGQTDVGAGAYGGMGVLDPETGAGYGNVADGPYYRPVVAPGPAGHVYAADSHLSPTGLYLYDVRGAAPVLVASRSQVCSNLRDLSARPDGAQVVTACGSPYQHDVHSADKLEPAGAYPSGAYPLAGAWSSFGEAFAAGVDSPYEPDVYLYPAGATSPTRVVDFGSTTETLLPRGLAVSADGSRVWAVTGSGGADGVALRVLDVPGPAPEPSPSPSPSPSSSPSPSPDPSSTDSPTTSWLTLEADPPAFYVGESTSVGGVLTAGDAGVAAAQVQVSRALDGGKPEPLATVTTDAYGAFWLRDTPPGVGSYTYTASWSGDGETAGSSARTVVEVWTTEATLQLALQSGPEPGTVVGGVRLSYAGSDSPAGQQVQLHREVAGTSTPLAPVTTGEYGTATFTDQPPGGDVVYRAAVAASGVHPPASTSAAITVLAPTSLTATAPPTAYAGEPVTTSGLLSSRGAALAGAAVSVERTGCSTAGWLAGTVTGPDGTWSVSDPSAPAGTCTYAAVFSGGNGYASSAASATVTVDLRPAELTLEVARGTGRNKKLVYLTAHLGGWHSNNVVTLTAQPVGGNEIVLASGSVDDAGYLSATYQPKTTTTYRARYAGDDWYRAAEVVQTP